MLKAYQELKQLYDSSASESEKNEKKKTYLAALQNELSFKRPISNATLIQFQTYSSVSHGFEEILASENGDIIKFLQSISRLKSSDFQKEQDENFNLTNMKF